MSRRKAIFLKATALCLSLIMLLEIVFPSAVFALTSGPTAPEVFAHQPADATDNVSLVTGDFNYTVPITSIPEYPMAIGYNSQGGMDQDAGIFGFSVNGFSGAIARSLQGLPDDISNAPRKYEYDNQKKWNASVTGTVSVSAVPVEGVGVGASASLMIGYDNYKGMFGGVGIGLSVGLKNLDVPVSAGIGASVTSESTLDLQGSVGAQLGIINIGVLSSSSYGVSGSIGIQMGKFEATVSGKSLKDSYASLSYTRTSTKTTGGVTKSKEETLETGFDLGSALSGLTSQGITDFSSQTNTVTSLLAPLASRIATTKSFAVSLTVPITGNISVTGSYSSFNYGNLNETKNAYGFMYLKDYDRRNRDNIADFTVEGEYSYDRNFRNSPAYLQRDFFIVNAQGISGSMQLHQDQHGVVSRNYNRYQTRDLGLVGLNTERKETEQWTDVSKAVINKQLDILKLLKKGDEEGDKDFDNTIFVEKELKSLTTDEYDFSDNKPSFKMRGDLAGEFNVASANSLDYKSNTYDLVHVQGTGGSRSFFLGNEKKLPLYYPQIPDAVNNKYNNAGAVKSSTQITYFTVEEVLNKLSGISEKNPLTDQKFAESYYTHHKIKNAGTKQTYARLDDSRLDDFNFLNYLKGIKNSQPKVDKVIADVRVKSADGLMYVYNLPVFNHSSKNLQLTGKGLAPPIQDGNDYASFSQSGKKNRNKIKEIEQYSYPYAWMLTAIVGPDYIDFDDIPGPSEGDLGYWVKFKYVQAATAYRWRFPFTGMEHNPVASHVVDDDAYSVATGTKEIYYISEIESSNYVSKYIYGKRFDGIDAAGSDLYNGNAHNSLNQNQNLSGDRSGSNSQYCVYRVELYKKHFEGDHSSKRLIADKKGKLLRATQFTYDYSTSPGVLNNLTNNGFSIAAGSVEYHASKSINGAQIGTGKLTLRKVQHVSYEGGEQAPVFLPSYEFNYAFDTNAEYNPDYDPKQVDQWGNYSKLSKKTLTNATGAIKDINGLAADNLNYYHSYPELDKIQADENAKVYKLSKVSLPAGGFLNVNYEAKGYGRVQDKIPYVMRPVKREIEVLAGTKLLKVLVDITDLQRENQKLESILLNKGIKYVHGELSFYESNSANFPAREDELFVSKEIAAIDHYGTVTTSDGRIYQELYLKHKKEPTKKIPFITEYRNYLFGESMKMKAVKENLNGGCNLGPILARYQSLEKDDPLDAAKKMIANVRNYFKSDNGFKNRFLNCFGTAENMVFEHQSFIRTPVYKEKYTGSRVKSLSFSDNFQYGTAGTGVGKVKRENVYTTNYFYDDQGNGKGVSEGVATIEPGGGESCVIDLRNKPGVGFFPSPSIMQARTTIETGYSVPEETAAVGQKISRKKGKVEYQFFSVKDKDYQIDNNIDFGKKVLENGKPNGRFFMFGIMSWLIIKFRLWPTKKKVTVKIPIPVPLNVVWSREDHYHLRSYAYTDMTDILGRPKAVVQYSGEGKEVTRSEFKYYGKDELVKVYDGSNGGLSNNPFANEGTMIKPGRMDQTWSEAYYTKEAKIKLIPWILLLHANTSRNFSYTNMKYTYLPPVLHEVTNTNSIDGTKTTAQYTAFDMYTGQPLEVRSADSYKNTQIARTVPAYWKYPKMGPSSLNSDNLNMLTASTGSYLYLNNPDDNNLLGVGISEWSQDQIRFVSTQRLTGKAWTTSDFNYQYELLDKDALEKLYNTNGKTRPTAGTYPASKVVNTYLPDAKWMSKQVKSYAFETPLKTNGTFSSFTPFVWGTAPAANSGWKPVSTNTLFDGYGRVVESKDILEKYAAAHFGCNFVYPTATVGNSTLAGAACTGAENTYLNATAGKTLDDHRIALADAEIMQSCSKAFTNKTFTYNTYTAGTQAKLLTICVPATPVYNVPFARFTATYNNSQGKSISRMMYISYDENKEFKIISERGESFNGFYMLPQPSQAGCSDKVKLAFEPSVFSGLDAGYTNSGYTVAQSNEFLSVCSMQNITYSLPDNDCGNEVHTGKYAFLLKSNNKKGTRFEVDFTTLPSAEKRKYKAMVWVHNSSPKQSTLIVEGSGGTLINSTTLATPYLTAGNWSLLRLEVDPGANTKLVFYVQNASSAGNTIYDDFRVLPYQATIENVIYDHKTGRVTARLDNENLAAFYNYDSRGRLVEVKTEVDKLGPQTIKKYVYHEQKGTN